VNQESGSKDRILTRVIIGVSVIGICYFGYRAISDNANVSQYNPFEYDLDSFKNSDAALVHYSVVGQINVDMQHVSGIAIDNNDNVYVTGDASVLQYDAAGNLQSTVTTGESAHCAAVDDNGDVYLCMRDHIVVYDGSGAVKARWDAVPDEPYITSIALSDEFVFVADAGNRIVWKFDKQGNRLMRIGEKNADKEIPGFIVPSPYFDVQMDTDGFLWVVNPGRHSLENYTLDGDLRSSWGEYGMEIEGFCGCCNPTHITMLDDGKFVTSEKGLARIKVYNRIGELVSIVAEVSEFPFGTIGLDLARDSHNRIYVVDQRHKAIRIYGKNQPL
jgi:hypothetical protein